MILKKHLMVCTALALTGAALPADASCLFLKLRSVPDEMAGQQRPSPDSLVTVVSRWPEFLKWSHTVLVAAAIDPDALSLRDARDDGWQQGLAQSVMVITDALTAKYLPPGCRTRVFRIIADSSIEELIKLKTSLQDTSSGNVTV